MVETADADLAASAAMAAADARGTLTWSRASLRAAPPRPSFSALHPKRCSLRELRWVWEQRMAASVVQTAPVTHALANEAAPPLFS